MRGPWQNEVNSGAGCLKRANTRSATKAIFRRKLGTVKTSQIVFRGESFLLKLIIFNRAEN